MHSYWIFFDFSANPDKLTMVVIALATSIASTGLPLITEAVTLKDRVGLAKLTSGNLQLFSFLCFRRHLVLCYLPIR